MKHTILQTSLIKSMQLLELLIEEGETGVSDLGRKKGLNRSNVHRILNTFESLGYVEKNPANSKYKPSLRFFELGSFIIQRNSLIKMAHPFLERLGVKFGETSNLAILDRDDVIYIDKVESSEALRMDLAVGRRVPAYCTALGKVLLAGLKKERFEEYLRTIRLVRRTPNTISLKRDFLKHLAVVSERGFAIDDEELSIGIRCIAAPVRNHSGDIVASVSIAGPSTRMTLERLSSLEKPLTDTALEISKQLGFRPQNRTS